MVGKSVVALRAIVCVIALSTSLVHHAYAQTYPSRPVRIIVATGAGGGADTLARLVAQNLGELWGASVFVENIPGAGGVVGTQAMVKAPPDGYTLGIISINHSINPAFYPKLPYDFLKDLRGVISLVSSVTLIVAHPSAAHSADELIKLAKSKPGAIDFGSSGKGGLLHVVMELFGQQAGIRMTHVPYRSLSQMVIDLVAGRVSVGAVSGATARSLIQAGKLKPLLVTSARRSRFFPDVPTGAEIGLPGFVASSWIGLAAPAQTPDAIVSKLYTDIATITQKKEFESQLVARGLEINLLNGEQLWKKVADEMSMWNRVVRNAGIKTD